MLVILYGRGLLSFESQPFVITCVPDSHKFEVQSLKISLIHISSTQFILAISHLAY